MDNRPLKDWDFGAHPSPIRRDTIVYSLGIGAVCVILMASIFVVGLLLKNERKNKPLKTIVYRGCYVWSDGHETCKRFTDRVGTQAVVKVE